ncbi:MAG TPA: hypothetical protein VGI43_15025 [Mucilaginibacter sp.]|jgi:hypothetical protein
MNEAAIKTELHDKIDHADPNQLKEIYGLLVNYFNGQETEEGWDSLSDYQKEKIQKSIDQGNAGLVTPVKEVIKMGRERYKLNG